ncbi:hypothetical protein EV1_033665 [Malus domestica]
MCTLLTCFLGSTCALRSMIIALLKPSPSAPPLTNSFSARSAIKMPTAAALSPPCTIAPHSKDFSAAPRRSSSCLFWVWISRIRVYQLDPTRSTRTGIWVCRPWISLGMGLGCRT